MKKKKSKFPQFRINLLNRFFQDFLYLPFSIVFMLQYLRFLGIYFIPLLILWSFLCCSNSNRNRIQWNFFFWTEFKKILWNAKLGKFHVFCPLLLLLLFVADCLMFVMKQYISTKWNWILRWESYSMPNEEKDQLSKINNDHIERFSHSID